MGDLPDCRGTSCLAMTYAFSVIARSGSDVAISVVGNNINRERWVAYGDFGGLKKGAAFSRPLWA